MDLRALRKSQWLDRYPCSIYFCCMGNDFFQFSSLNGLIQSWVNMSKTTLASLGSDKPCISTSAVMRLFYLLTFKRHSYIQFLCSLLHVNPEWLWLSAGYCRYKATLCLGISADEGTHSLSQVISNKTSSWGSVESSMAMVMTSFWAKSLALSSLGALFKNSRFYNTVISHESIVLKI